MCKQALLFYAATEKYPLECVFVYNFVFLGVSLFSTQACCIFMWTCLCIYSECYVNALFQNISKLYEFLFLCEPNKKLKKC